MHSNVAQIKRKSRENAFSGEHRILYKDVCTAAQRLVGSIVPNGTWLLALIIKMNNDKVVVEATMIDLAENIDFIRLVFAVYNQLAQQPEYLGWAPGQFLFVDMQRNFFFDLHGGLGLPDFGHDQGECCHDLNIYELLADLQTRAMCAGVIERH